MIDKQSLFKFLYSPNLYFGLRKALGLFIPILIFFGIFKEYEYGFAFASGTLCVSIIDLVDGSTRKARLNELLIGLSFITISTFLTNIVAPYPNISWLLVCFFVFFFSMLSVYGKVGGIIGFSSLLSIMLAITYPLHYQDSFFQNAFSHALLTFSGGFFYFLFIYFISFTFKHHQDRQVIANALYATADYIKARSTLYDNQQELGSSYSILIDKMSPMFEKHQIARDVVLREFASKEFKKGSFNTRIWNIFISMIALLDSMVATQTDYKYLRDKLGEHDVLLFMRDTLIMLSKSLNMAATDLLRHQPLSYRHSVKAELKALEYEIEQFKKNNLQKTDPELYLLLIQIQRRLRNATFAVEQITKNLSDDKTVEAINTYSRNKSLLQFRTVSDYSFKALLRNLNFNSPIFRYAIRTTLAIFSVQLATLIIHHGFPDSHLQNTLMSHSHWILITILLIMRPGFALTQQRMVLRLLGTLLGCLIVLGMFVVTDSIFIYLAVMISSMILGNALTQSNYRLGSMFITIYVLIGFYFLSPSVYWVIGERMLDTLIACLVSFAFSFILPQWEKQQIPKLAKVAILKTQQYLETAINYIQTEQQKKSPSLGDKSQASLATQYIDLQLARKNLHIAYASFADSLARMLNEPKRHQLDSFRYNRLLNQTDALNSQINSLVPILVNYSEISTSTLDSLNYIKQILAFDKNINKETPPPINAEEQYLDLRFPLKQMYQATQMISTEATYLSLEHVKV